MRIFLAKLLLLSIGIGRVIGSESWLLPTHQVRGLRARTLKYSKGNMKQCVPEVGRRLGLDKIKFTDPKLLEEILANDMRLEDLDSVQVLLGDRRDKKMPLQPMISRVYNSIEKKYPIVVQFLCEALDEDLIDYVETTEAKDIIERSVHHAYILDFLIRKMAIDWQFMVEIQDHLLEERQGLGLPAEFMDFVRLYMHLTGQAFEAIKTMTMDWVFSQYEEFRSQGVIPQEDMQSRIAGLQFNILEACIAENLNGYNDNAMAGIALAVNKAKAINVTDDGRDFLLYELSEPWVSLYESWNLAFITGNVKYLHLLFPKLLIPAVIDTEADEYMFNRALALWVSVNFFMFAQFSGKPDHPLPNADELARLWGRINREHAVILMQELQGVPLDVYAPVLDTTYAELWDDLGPLLVYSKVITQDDADELSEMLAVEAGTNDRD